MAYRNGTYVAFHANGTNVPGGNSDIDYYNLMKAWTAKSDDEFTMNNSHDKVAAVRDSSRKATLRASLLERLRNSKNMVLIIGETTLLDDDWVPFEIERAVDSYNIPIIATYTGIGGRIMNPNLLRSFWPASLASRIDDHSAGVIHIPFKKAPLLDAISQFTHAKRPVGQGLGVYSLEAYAEFGIHS